VDNAGISGPNVPGWDYPPQEWATFRTEDGVLTKKNRGL